MKITIPTTLLLAFVALPSLLNAQGPLVPPTSSVGPTGPNPPLVGGNPTASMKTLHEVEPSRSINAINAPGDATFTHIISTAGAYHLTEPLLTAGKSGIKITVPHVTLDLRGYSIRSIALDAAGIEIAANADGCTVRNGIIRDFRDGVDRANPPSVPVSGSYENLTVTGQTLIGLNGGHGWTVSNCRVYEGNNTGISVGDGSVVTNCSVSDLSGTPGTNGISLGAGSVIRNCAVRNCTVLNGIVAGQGSTIENCAATGNTGDATTGFSYGIRAENRSLIRGCSATGNTHPSANDFDAGAGISAGFSSLVIDCHAYANSGDGILIAQGCRVTGCRSSSNGLGGVGAGVHAWNYSAGSAGWNEIINNDFVFNVTGIDIDTSANMVVQNRCGGSSSENFNVVTNNRVGPIVIPFNSGAINGTGSGQAAGMGSTDPWANFTY